MALRNVNVLNSHKACRDVVKGEGIGRDLAIHRECFPDGNTGNLKASGKQWVVSLRHSGWALVTGIRTRQQARSIAQALCGPVAELRFVCEAARDELRWNEEYLG